jgi:7-cyano-7-deazaguanine synthase
MKKICVLVSGGVDSAMLVAERLDRGERVYPLYVRCGLRWEDVELAWLRKFLKRVAKRGALEPLHVAEAPIRPLLVGHHWSLDGRGVPKARSPWDAVRIPGRNVVLLSQAGLFCAARGIDRVAQAILKGNPFSDATPRFRAAMQSALRAGLGRPIRLEAPYAKLTKAQVLRRAARVPLELTFSCIKPRGFSHCGKCSKCEERGWVLPK